MHETVLSAIDAFLAEARNAIVIGTRRNGRPHATPNWFLWEDGRFYVSTTKSRAKYRVFSHNPSVQIVVDDSVGFRYLVADGTVEIDEDVEGQLRHFAAIRAKHGRAPAGDAELLAELRRDDRVMLVITPARAAHEWLRTGL